MGKVQCRGLNHDGTRCSRAVVKGFEWCLFHHPNKQGSMLEDFRYALEDELSSQLRIHPSFLDFTGFNFTIPLLFMEDIESVYFGNAVFSDSVIFWNIDEQRGLVFSGETVFNDALFLDVVDFGGSKFQEAYFVGAVFRELADFSETVFRRAYFNKAIFENEARFNKSYFAEFADFSEANFLGDGDFSEATSLGQVLFKRCSFLNAWFIKANLHKVDFQEAVFFGDIDFFESNIKNFEKKK